MADRHDYYFGEVVTESELDEGFDFQEQADWDQNTDMGLTGIAFPQYQPVAPWPNSENLGDVNPSWTPREDGPPSTDMIVDTGYGYDKDGKRLAVDPSTSVVVDCSQDYLGVSNAVAVGNERWIGLFLKFNRALSDPRTDDNGLTVWFLQEESYTIEVHQGPEELAPAVTRPALLSDGILLCDVIYTNGTPAAGIMDADRDFSRTEYLVNLDMSAFMGAIPSPMNGRIIGRNLAEAFWNAFFLVGIFANNTYIPLAGSNQITGELTPAVSCTDDLGKVGQQWKKLYAQATQVAPSTVSGASSFRPDQDWDPIFGHSYAGHVNQSIDALIGAAATSWVDLEGRHGRAYLDEWEDFLTHDISLLKFGAVPPAPGGINNTDRYTVNNLGATPGTWAFNAAPFVDGGFVKLTAAAPGDAVSVNGSIFPARAGVSQQPWRIEHGFWIENFDSVGSLIRFGAMDSGGGIYEVIYDPGGVILAAPSPNIWIRYADALGGGPFEFDTGFMVLFGLNIWGVEIGRDSNTGDMIMSFYGGRGVLWQLNLTTLGVYGNLATFMVDVFAYVGAGGGAVNPCIVNWDWHHTQAHRQF